MALVPTFTIITMPGADTILALRGRALPYQGYVLEGSMRAEFTWYPGNAVASVQMLGAEEKPTTIHGMWKDRFIRSTTDEGFPVDPEGVALLNGQQVADVFELVKTVEKIRLSGQLVRVQWNALVREGIITSFKQDWKRREDVEWELTFGWVSRGEVQSPVTLPLSPSADSFSQQLRTLVDSLEEAATLPTEFEVVASFVNQVNVAISDIDDATFEVENAVAASVSQVTIPLDAAERTLAATRTIQQRCDDIVDIVGSFPALSLISTTEPGTLGLADALVADAYSRGIKEAAQAVRQMASDQGQTLRATAREESLLAAFTARADLDLRDISQTYYSTPDEWRRLLQYNALADSRVAAGQLVLVPRITFVDLGT